MTSIMLIIVSVVLIIISLRDINWASKQHLRNKIETSCDPILSANDARELTDECNRKIIENQFNEIMGYIKEECVLGKSEFIRYKMLPEVQEKLEHLGYTIEVIYDDNDSIVDNEYHFVIKW